MTKARSLVGLDVLASKIVAAVLDAETGELTFFWLSCTCRGCGNRAFAALVTFSWV